MPNSDSRGGECHVATVSSPVEWDSNSLAIRKDMVILPPPYADMGSHRWTALYLVTPPLPAEIPAVRFDITSHDQGWCSDPQSGVWSWFEVSILRPITQDVNATRDHVPQITDLKSCPEDFTEVLQAQGLFFRTLPTNDEPGPGLHQVTQPLVRNRINRAWQSHTIIWRVGNLSEDGEGLLDLVQSGDRLAVWARAEFPGWMNFIKEVQIKFPTGVFHTTNSLKGETFEAPLRAPMDQANTSIREDRPAPTSIVRMLGGVLDGNLSQQVAPYPPTPSQSSTSTSSIPLALLSLGSLAPLIETRINENGARDSFASTLQTLEGRPQERTALFIGSYHFFQGLKMYRDYEMTGRMDDLENSIQQMQRGVDSMPVLPGDSSPLTVLAPILGIALMIYCKKTKNSERIPEAIKYMQHIDIIGYGDDLEMGPSIALALSALSYQWMFEQLGELQHLNESICRARKGVDAIPPQRIEFQIFSALLGTLIIGRFEVIGEVEDLNEAILRLESVKDASSHRKNMPQVVVVLANALHRRYERTGSISDLDQGIQYAQEAVESPSGLPDLALQLSNLGRLLACRFERQNRLEDIYEAIQRTQQAASMGSGEAKISSLDDLGTHLLALYNRTKKVEYLREAIQYAQQAVDHTYEKYDILPVQLNETLARIEHNLSHMNVLLYWEDDRLEAIFSAIEQAKHAVDITPNSHPTMVIYLKNLGHLLALRFSVTGRIEDLREAVRLNQQVIDLTAEDDPKLALYLQTLGTTYSWFDIPVFQGLAIENLCRSWKCASGAPIVRLKSARKAIRILKRQSRWIEALDLAKQAVNMIPDINNRSLSRDDQRLVSLYFSRLAEDICSFILQLNGDPLEALCRGVFIGQLMDDRSGISTLTQSYPEEAALYERLRNEVNTTSPETQGNDFRLIRTQKLLKAVTSLEECIANIRKLPGFAQFLLGPNLSELKHHAAEGPIVLINVSDIRSDAIIIQSSGVESVHLSQLTREKTTEWIEQSLTTYRDPLERGKKNKRYGQFLKWLWTSCVEIILARVFAQGQDPQKNEYPRIWWIGVGIAAHLPFHAAGDHSAGSRDNTISQVISSYAPTVKSLIYSRERKATTAEIYEDKPNILIVTMPHTPGEIDLPGVEREEEVIKREFKSALITCNLKEPTSKNVLDKLTECDIFHFAGHGISDNHDPFNSSLLLSDHDETSPVVDKLSVRDVFDLHLKEAKIAYLSACSTAEIREEKLLDEVIHLASGFQVAGFSHVIASTQQTDDEACEEMATEFYRQLKDMIKGALDNRAIAAATHYATLAVRSRWPRQPLMWTPYVHIGI